MEIKLNEPIKETECVAYEGMSGMMHRTTVEKTLRLLQELNDQLLPANHKFMTLREMYEVITQDWPEEDRIKFFERFDACEEGWTVNHKTDDIKFDLIHTITEDGKFLMQWILKDD